MIFNNLLYAKYGIIMLTSTDVKTNLKGSDEHELKCTRRAVRFSERVQVHKVDPTVPSIQVDESVMECMPIDKVQDEEIIESVPEFVGPKINFRLLDKCGLWYEIITPPSVLPLKKSDEIVSLTSSTEVAYSRPCL